MAETKTLTAQCHCKAVHYSITLPTSSFPLKVHLCHCSICRYTHGTLCIFHAPLPKDLQLDFRAPSSMANLTGYKHARSRSERFFCSTCGAHIGDSSLDADEKGRWIVATSLFVDHSEENFRINGHVLTKCAPGGGLFDLMPKIGDRDMVVWNPKDDDPEWDMSLVESQPELDADGNERLRAQCHCAGVSFAIPRPTLPAIRDDAFASKYVSPEDPTKWSACLDTCDDCRLVSGAHVIGWTFVPRVLLDPPMPRALAPYGTMKVYESSPGVRRGFCGVCGATVIFACDVREPTEGLAIVDVATGVLRAPGGVMAEDWLTWRTGRLAWPQDGMKYDAGFAKSLEEGLAKWGEQKHGKVLGFGIG